MKKLNIFLIITAAFLCISAVNAQTQADCTARNITINTAVTNATCQSNGTVTVTLSGDIAGLQQIHYSLQSAAEGGFSLQPTLNNVLEGIPPGTYIVTVSAFCDALGNYTVTKTKTNVVVGGTYTVPTASFVPAGRTATGPTAAPTSRKSYAGCATGKIVINMRNGNQTANPVFTITAAPAGVSVPQNVNVTRYTGSGSLSAGYVYTLDGLYPAGNYTVQINDGCYTAAVSLNLGEMNTFPNPRGEASTSVFNYTNILAYENGDNPNCALIRLSLMAPLNTTPDFYQYYRDSLYEIGAAPIGQMPTNWTTWTYEVSNPVINLSPNKISDFYGSPAKMSVYFRMKNCPSVYAKYDVYINTPSINFNRSVYCSYYNMDNSWIGYSNVVCYPLQHKEERVSDGVIVHQTNGIMNATQLRNDTVKYLEYGVAYRNIITDNSGYQLSTTTTYSYPPVSYSDLDNRVTSCRSWQNRYTWSTLITNYCYPIYVVIKDTRGVIAAYDTIRADTDPLYNATNNLYSPDLNYNQSYTFTFTYPNRIVNGVVYTSSYTRSMNMPTSYTMSNYNVSTYGACQINYGRLQIRTNDINILWPEGTVFTITGPEPFGTRTYTATNSNYYYYFPDNLPVPPGAYTLMVNHGEGCEPLVFNLTLPGVYDVQNFKTEKELTCEGLKVRPQGTLTLEGNPVPIYYRLVSGPAGYNQNPINAGGSVTLTREGTYILGVMINATRECYLKRDTIVYTAAPMALDLTKTSAYICIGSSVGNITLQAKNGVTPYTYELWNKANTVRLLSPVSSSTNAVFNYGSRDSTYTVRITDVCGNSFNQQITMADLETAKLVFSSANPVCYGSDIQISCLTLGETTYKWKGPKGFASTEQYPVIHNADTTNTGWYVVSIKPELCGSDVKDSIYITVLPPVDMKQYANQTFNVSFCPRELIKLDATAKGGSGSFTYQWARSTNGTTYTNITGAVGTSAVFSSADAAYQFVSTTANPTYTYFRCQITDAQCGSFYVYYHTSASPCMLPVNPNLMNLPKGNPLKRQKN